MHNPVKNTILIISFRSKYKNMKNYDAKNQISVKYLNFLQNWLIKHKILKPLIVMQGIAGCFSISLVVIYQKKS